MKKKKARKNPWTTLAKKPVFENAWIKLSHHDVLTPSGTKGEYGLVEFKNLAVGVLAIDERDRVLLVGQWRYPLQEYSWELPEGGSPKGESALATAKRELKEETGYTARRWSKLLDLALSNSVTDERAVIFLASEFEAGESEPEDTEELEVKWMPLKKAIRMAEKGEITDAISVAALLRAATLRRPAVRKKVANRRARD